MADVHSAETRSYNMSQIRSKNTKPELAVRKYLFAHIIALNSPESANLAIVIERRGKREDKQLTDHFQTIMARGTGKLSKEEIALHNPTFTFRNKKENINGLQLADLVAYPIARYVIEPEKANPAFDILEPKIYRTDKGLDGLKIYP